MNHVFGIMNNETPKPEVMFSLKTKYKLNNLIEVLSLTGRTRTRIDHPVNLRILLFDLFHNLASRHIVGIYHNKYATGQAGNSLSESDSPPSPQSLLLRSRQESIPPANAWEPGPDLLSASGSGLSCVLERYNTNPRKGHPD